MAQTILPSGEEISVTPAEILKYLNPDGLRQVFRQERLRWNLKTNKDIDYTDVEHLYKYIGEVHNEGLYQRMELRTEPDNGAYSGYAGINIDSGLFGLPHNVEKWDQSMTAASQEEIVNRVVVGATASIPDKTGTGLNELGQMDHETSQRAAMIVMDPYDGRAYLLSNDDTVYVNNDTRSPENKIPLRAIARIADIPTKTTQMENDLHYIADPAYHHTDNNFSISNRFLVDNLDDRTFVYPEISKDENGEFIENIFMGLNGKPVYAEGDSKYNLNTQEDIYHDRGDEAISSYNENLNYSGVEHKPGYIPGIFRSLEELEKVDLVHQKQTPFDSRTPGAKRPYNYYLNDGAWTPTWFDSTGLQESYMADPLLPSNMEIQLPDRQPIPYSCVEQSDGSKFDRSQLYQWRYNRIDVVYNAKDISIEIQSGGKGYKVGDILDWIFADITFQYRVTKVGAIGQIQEGKYIGNEDLSYSQDPGTYGIGVEFVNSSGSGSGAKLIIKTKATFKVCAGQLKNNLYAYVDITPTIRSDNSSPWADLHFADPQGGKIGIRSTAAGPSYSGINSGRGGPGPNEDQSGHTFFEHGGNATAGMHVHLFRYVINTESPEVITDGDTDVYVGKWVDQGPMGIERPSDVKALLFSNSDTNNFNNYYKFTLDTIIDNMDRSPDAVETENPNAVSSMFLHLDQVDPTPDRKFTMTRIDPTSSEVKEVNITDQVLYVNVSTGVLFLHNTGYKSDLSYGYGYREPGWFALAGVTSR